MIKNHFLDSKLVASFTSYGQLSLLQNWDHSNMVWAALSAVHQQGRMASIFARPDPLNFAVWSILEANACAKPAKSLDALKRNLMKEWDRIEQTVLCAACQDFKKLWGVLSKQRVIILSDIGIKL